LFLRLPFRGSKFATFLPGGFGHTTHGDDGVLQEKTVKRPTLYFRLQPRNWSTKEGRRHHGCLPVELLRKTNDEPKPHPNSHVAAASVKCMNDLCTLLPATMFNKWSNDDKANVPLALPPHQKKIVTTAIA
jgi:hypothetical protein